MDTFYFNRFKAIIWFLLFTTLFAFWMVALILAIKNGGSYFTPIIWLLICGVTTIRWYQVLLASIKNEPALIITDEYISIFRAFKPNEVIYWNDIEFFRKREGLAIENIEVKLTVSIDIKNQPYLVRKWLSMRNYRLFNIGIIDASNSYIINSLDTHSMEVIPE